MYDAALFVFGEIMFVAFGLQVLRSFLEDLLMELYPLDVDRQLARGGMNKKFANVRQQMRKPPSASPSPSSHRARKTARGGSGKRSNADISPVNLDEGTFEVELTEFDH